MTIVTYPETASIDDKGILALDRESFYRLIGKPKLPVGAYSTIDYWIRASGCTVTSHVFLPGCSTGLAALAVALATGCSVDGSDYDKESVQLAISNAELTGVGMRTAFYIESTTLLDRADATYSHVFVSPWWGNQWSTPSRIKEITRLLQPNGYLCTADLISIETVPATLQEQAADVLELDLRYDLEQVDRLKNQWSECLHLVDDQLETAPEIDPKRYEDACNITIKRFAEESGCSESVATAASDRLRREGKLFSELRDSIKLQRRCFQRHDAPPTGK